jgi:hypothetical protein
MPSEKLDIRVRKSRRSFRTAAAVRSRRFSQFTTGKASAPPKDRTRASSTRQLLAAKFRSVVSQLAWMFAFGATYSTRISGCCRRISAIAPIAT